MPKRIQLRRTKGWRKPEGAIVVSRPSRWGNPWRVQLFKEWTLYPYYLVTHPESKSDVGGAMDARVARLMAVEEYRKALRLERLPYTTPDVRRELRGRDLCCWCPPGQPCHADVLLEIANS